MTDLSPAAQAVLDAYETADCEPYEIDPRRAGLAAALRAVADPVADLQVPWFYTGESYQTYNEGLLAAAEHLRAIAAELEALPND